MAELSILTQAYALSTQPIVIVRRARIAFMNKAAESLIGANVTDEIASSVFPVYVLNTQAETFITTAVINGKSCDLRIEVIGSCKVIALTCRELPPFEYSAVFTQLRSVLSNIHFASRCMSAIAEEDGSGKLLEYLRTLNRSYYRLKCCVENTSLLDALSKNELPFFPHATDLAELCSDMTDSVRLLLKHDDISLSFYSEEKVNIVADRSLVEIMLLNLLSNSIAHTGRGGHISVSLLRTDKNVIISVDDDGDGIESDELAYVFDKFRSAAPISDSLKGAGLGLAIVRGIAERHDGTMIIESRGRDKGTSVRVMLSSTLPVSSRFASSKSEYSDGSSLVRLLTALSGCLPADCFSPMLDD